MCGIFGVWRQDAAKVLFDGMYAIQQRGKESAGAAILTENGIRCFKSMGFVNDLFKKHPEIRHTRADAAIGHIRYSTSGKSTLENAQPVFGYTKFGPLAIVHNGTLTNEKELRAHLLKKGAVFQAAFDSELFLHLIAHSEKKTLHQAIADALEHVSSAYSLLILSKDALYAVRDPYGFWGLSIGSFGYNKGYVFASETVAIDNIGAQFQCEVPVGSIASISDTATIRFEYHNEALSRAPGKRNTRCSFDILYLSNPASRNTDSNFSVYHIRERLGRFLAETFKRRAIPVDIVVPVPDSGNIAALGFHQASGIPLEYGLIRGHYTTRTFIEPEQEKRAAGVRMKFDPVIDIVRGKRVALVDDSLVRSTTSRKLVSMLKHCGTQEVHVLIASPPVRYPCPYGIDMKSVDELIASRKSTEEIRQEIDADSLTYLPSNCFKNSFGNDNHCSACFDCG
ncbi:MAG: amidophosphoribosyltransferase [Candidatus Lloydbacteria bacterium CG22_combo_CG10-13_8_21_14_all_47_15]|uniref:Amidophosphoribosyltransferase n=1 Tax=Candidatus Lloydbacteria bacterium CG22_combo_CG10-13_8_21_14_all_47_15 TaxID=1974635 RepID=A0A2H0CUG8_9BACT|nr:MAG: amidophosphoribosyltransferase [Candidatus Lloydbacteria bacterium CG22_combo_CG10-13_8_21_14_all_47_15]